MKALQIIAFIGLILVFLSATMLAMGHEDKFVELAGFLGCVLVGVGGGIFLIIKMKKETRRP